MGSVDQDPDIQPELAGASHVRAIDGQAVSGSAEELLPAPIDDDLQIPRAAGGCNRTSHC